MKRLFLWLCSAPVLSFIAVLVGCLMIWTESPLISYDGHFPFDSATVRWVLIFVLLGLWGAFWLWRHIAEKRAATNLMKVVAGEGSANAELAGNSEANAELQALAGRMQDAIGTLRRARRGGSGQLMYQLPWYMIVGSPGAGKTTALTHSGLQFPLAGALGKNVIGGVGGTRNCDWWFTDEAVLLDTAGRYTTQDSFAEVDSAAWNGFLGLLTKFRKRRPLNGVIVAISVADLLQKDEAGRRELALAIRGRIKELHEKLGIRFPIYVMVTKCDLLAGFMAFFDNLTREERAQVWGITFPLLEADRVDVVLGQFPEEFQALERQLQARVLERLQSERGLQRRALMYGFPQQFAGLGDALGQLLIDIFHSTRYEERAMLRGVYFTSGTQEGNPIDRVIGSLAQAFGLDRQVLPANVASGRSFFVTQMLRAVIFKEAGLAGANLRLERERRFLQWGVLVLLVLLLGAVLTARLTSYFGNRQLQSEIESRTTTIEKIAAGTPRSGSLPSLLPLLGSVRGLPAGYAARGQPVPVLMRLGLYQGARLSPVETALYARLLRENLLPRLVARMEDQLRRGDANNQDFLYEALRTYLLMGDARRFDAEALQAWFDFDFANNLPQADAAQRAALSQHVAALLEGMGASGATLARIDPGLVNETRLVLARLPLPQRIFNRMKKEFARAPLPEFSAGAAGGQGASLVLQRRSGEPLTRGVPGLYTIAGYKKFVDEANQAIADMAQDGWVLGQQEALASLSDIEQTKKAVLELYFGEYIRQWDAYLADVAVASFSSLEEGARLTALLAGADSPLRKFLQGAAQETRLDAVQFGLQAPDSLMKVVRGKIDLYKKKLSAALGDTTPQATPEKLQNPVDAHFSELQRLVGPGGGAPAPLDSLLANLKAVAVYFDEADRARRGGTPMPGGDALQKIKREAGDLPAPLGSMLAHIDSVGGGITLGSDRARLNAAWSVGGAQFCRQAISGRYPLLRTAANDVLADDFGKFFAPGGLADDFFQKNLLPFVDTTEARWHWRVGARTALGISAEVLAQFQRAADIRDMFFSAGAKQPSMRFEIKPVSADPGVASVLLEVDGQLLTYAPGEAGAPALFQVPSGKRSGQARLEILPPGPHTTLRTEGPWAWLHLMDQALLEVTPQRERFRMSYDLGGRKLVLDLLASSVVNPFRREVLEQFRCPDQL